MTDDRFQFVDVDDTESEHIAAPKYSYWQSVFKKFFSSKVTICMLLIVLFVLLMSIFHPMISHYDHMVMAVNKPETHFLRPSAEHWFGTDDVGREMFDMLWAGTRTSLFVAFTATAISTIIGVIVGMFWGYSKRMDTVMIEIYNVIANIPFTLLAMILMYAFGQGVPQLIFALCCTNWINTAYFMRVQVMIIRDREYNMASKCLGTPVKKIIVHNILPYLISVIVTSVSRDVPNFISYEVFLGYVGVGLTQKTASLGRIVEENAQYMTSAPYLFVIPVFITALISVSLYIVGQTLADASDPRTHMI